MKFMHLSDLHIGKRLNDLSLIEDQAYALDRVIELAARERVDAVLIAGDVYQKASPQAEAMTLFDSFLTRLAEKGMRVFIISGNHDSDRRISYFSKFLKKTGVFVSEAFEGMLQTVTVSDEYGPIYIHLLPFLRPTSVKRFFPDSEIHTYEDAVRAVISHSNVDQTTRNVLICHQLVTGAETCDSEEEAVGGLDNISPSAFEGFDYVALGHIHKPQRAGRDNMRYAGSLLKYSLSEKDHKKSVCILEMKEKGDLTITLHEIETLRDVREVRGEMNALLNEPYSEDYVRCVVTDELPPPDARVTLSTVFPNMIKFSIENSKTQADMDISPDNNIENKSVMDLFSEFFMLQNGGQTPSDKHLSVIEEILKEMEEQKHEAD
ncbi:MAG: exonuclease SbcCD subunit D [Clostridiales bacterium]|nr:exonuclease SbcCD subunit D [Clostridiales bacterium]